MDASDQLQLVSSLTELEKDRMMFSPHPREMSSVVAVVVGTSKVDDGNGKKVGNDDDDDDYLKRFGCQDNWCWSSRFKSPEVLIYGIDRKTVLIHPVCSIGAAGIQGTKALNRGDSDKYYFWEIQVSDRVFGTSMMFGVGTRNCSLHVDAFNNLIGRDKYGWGLSHKGYLWHDGHWQRYCEPFRENESTRIGLFFDAVQGSLTYFKDGTCLGVAFTGLDQIEDDLYPMVSSTAVKTKFTISAMRRDFCNLQDRCREVILGCIRGDDAESISALQLPTKIREFLEQEMDVRRWPRNE